MDNTCEMSKIGERISELLKSRKISQKELAEKVGVTESAMSRYIKGDRVPRASMMAQIATALGVSADYLMCGINQDELNQAQIIIARNAPYMTNAQKKEIIELLMRDK